MPKMDVHRDPEDFLAGQTIIGPCPGCYLWTLQFGTFEFPPAELSEIVEALLQEHLSECSGLREIVDNTR